MAVEFDRLWKPGFFIISCVALDKLPTLSEPHSCICEQHKYTSYAGFHRKDPMVSAIYCACGGRKGDNSL